MLSKLIFALIAAIAVSQTAQVGPKEPPKPYDVAEAYQVYSAILSMNPPKDELLIAEATVPFKGCLDSHSDKLVASAIEDYKKANQASWLLQRQFDLGGEYKLLPDEEINAFAEHNPYASIPKGSKIIRFSAVGFNADKTVAFVNMEVFCGSMCASGYPRILQKQDGKWRAYTFPQVHNPDGTVQPAGSCMWFS